MYLKFCDLKDFRHSYRTSTDDEKYHYERYTHHPIPKERRIWTSRNFSYVYRKGIKFALSKITYDDSYKHRAFMQIK